MKKSILLIVIVLLYSFLNANMLFAAANTWTQKSDFGGTARAMAIGFSIGSKGYIGTGKSVSAYKDFWEYDPFLNTWTQKAGFGGVERSGAVGFSIGTKGYIGTGYDGDLSLYYKDFWEYDPLTNTWTQKADFGGVERYHAVGFSIGSKGYIGTGSAADGNKKDFWEYDPSTNTWTRKADFGVTIRYDVVGFSIGSKGYLGTGNGGSSLLYKDFWEYDPSTNIWTQKADFGGAMRASAVGFSIASKGYIGTGMDSSLSYLQDFWEYDPVLNTWTQMADFGGAGREYAVGFSVGSKGYLGTGSGKDESSSYIQDFWEYEPNDTDPAQFTFIDQTGVDINTVVTSNTIVVSGINLAAPISIIGGTYSINGGEYTSASGTVNNGYVVTVQQTSSGSNSTTTNAILTIGGTSDTFSVRTLGVIPEQFTFIDQTGVDINTVVTSNTITVSGITAETPISITGGTYSINGGPYTRARGTVTNGKTVTVQQNSATIYSTKTNATLTIGGISDTFSVTTKASSVSASECFIATAAFGSPMVGQVKILRQFRDRYLMKNALGQKFVAWYYRNGPVAANFIKDKPLVKAAVRVALYPLIGFSFLLISGYLPFVIVGLLLFTLLFTQIRSKKLIAK